VNSIETPYYVVIFTSRKSADLHGYAEMAERMQTLCSAQPGFLKIVHSTSDEGASITSCYWQDLASISAWKANADHQVAQDQGIARWYDEYQIEIARIERAYFWKR
jgi:heme-degrading monooxygenase HmoA